MKNLKKIIGFLVFAFMVLTIAPSISYAADGQEDTNVWQEKAPMQTARSYFRSEVIDGKIYVIGGINENNSLNTVEVYDPTTNKWASLAPMPKAQAAFHAEVIDNKIYVISDDNTNTVEAYDPATNKWTSLASMNTTRELFQTEVVDGKIYAIGGRIGSTPSNTVEVYDPASNKWKSLAPMGTGRYYLQTEVVDGKIYAIGGYNNYNAMNTVEVYDPITNKWASLAPMITARDTPQTEVVDGKIYIICGSIPGETIKTAEVYDPATNKWASLASMTTVRINYQAEVIDSKIYVIGGFNDKKAMNTVEMYDPATNKWSTLSSMSVARCNFQTEVINDKIYVIGGISINGTREYLSSVETYTYKTVKLTAPTNLTASASNAQVKLTWDTVDGAMSFNIKRSETAGGPYDTIASVSGSAVTFNDTKVNYGKTYYYVVSAVKSDIESPNSNEASATLTKSSEITGNRAILVISFNNSKEKEYDLSADEIDKFIRWYDSKSDGSGKSYFKMPKHSNVKPFISRYEYIKYDNIESFEIKDYNMD